MPRQYTILVLLLAMITGAAGIWLALRAGPEPAASPSEPLDVASLDSEKYAERFLAVMELARSEEHDFDQRLDATLRGAALSESARARLEFVRWKRSGEQRPASATRDEGSRPSVLMISIDTLRADHLSCYGYERKTSPSIDALAARGAVFENAFSTAPWTLPGHMSMFTSLYPSFHKAEWRFGRLDSSVKTMTESLKSLGYRTAAFVTHPFLSKRYGFGSGFDLYFRHPRIVRAEVQTDAVIDWIDWHFFLRERGDPTEFFLFVHYMDPHETYDAPEPFGGRYTQGYSGALKPDDHLVTMFSDDEFESVSDYEYAVGLYDEEISYVDHAVGRLLNHLEQRGALDSMIVVLTSDHGEELKDHGSMGHQSSLYREQLHVPLIITSPSTFAPGTRVTTQASVVDIFPTVVGGLLGGDVPPQAQGFDLCALVPSAGRPTPRSPVYAELGPMEQKWQRTFHKRSIRTEQYSLIFDLDDRSKLLFDLERDPAEHHDLYPRLRHRPDIRALESRLERFTNAGASFAPAALQEDEVELDQKTKDQLRALGYIE